MLLSDVVFLPSREEGFGVPIQEASALRAPVLCSDIPAYRETGGELARFFAAGAAPSSIATQVMEIAREPANAERREALRSRSRCETQLAELARLRMQSGSGA
jgi:glycosyltransferase involved in cell wall biosynthesis